MGFKKDKVYKSLKTGRQLKGEFVQQLLENAGKMGREDLEAEILLSWVLVDDEKK